MLVSADICMSSNLTFNLFLNGFDRNHYLRLCIGSSISKTPKKNERSFPKYEMYARNFERLERNHELTARCSARVCSCSFKLKCFRLVCVTHTPISSSINYISFIWESATCAFVTKKLLLLLLFIFHSSSERKQYTINWCCTLPTSNMWRKRYWRRNCFKQSRTWRYACNTNSFSHTSFIRIRTIIQRRQRQPPYCWMSIEHERNANIYTFSH